MARGEPSGLEESVFHGADGGFRSEFWGRGHDLGESVEDGGPGRDDIGT